MKKIIILRRTPYDGGFLLAYVAWYPVAPGREVPLSPGRASSYLEATPEETLAINTGAVIEEKYSVPVPTGTTAAQVKTALINRYNAREAELAAMPNPNQFYGVFWDGTTWNA